MKTLGFIVSDIRTAPKRLWEIYGLALIFMLAFGFVIHRDTGWFLGVVVVVAAWGIFSALMATFRYGQFVAYSECADILDTAADDMVRNQATMAEVLDRLEDVQARFDRFQGPS